MDSMLVSLLPFIIGSALVPLQIIMVILLLTSEKRGPLKASLFVLGMTLARLVQGFLFGYVFTGGSGDTTTEDPGIPWVKATLLTVLGLLLLISAYRTWRKEPDPDAPPPRWLTMFETMTPGKALLMGAGLILIAAKLWVFTLGALSTIREAQLEPMAAILWYLVYILLAQSLLIIPILIRLIVPKRATELLVSTGDWLEKYNNPIVITVSLVFGVLFLYQGISAFF